MPLRLFILALFVGSNVEKSFTACALLLSLIKTFLSLPNGGWQNDHRDLEFREILPLVGQLEDRVEGLESANELIPRF
jgi:hypothetical protein